MVDEKLIIDTLRQYLEECKRDDEDRWITREYLHRQVSHYDELKEYDKCTNNQKERELSS